MTWKVTAAFIATTFAAIVSPAFAQGLIETYTAEISAQDRRNSKGVALSEPAAILAQDRANVHRFGMRQAGDTVDRIFRSRELRARMPSLLSRGSLTPAAEAALRSGNISLLEISVWGQGSNINHITVDVAAAGIGTIDALLSPAESAGHAVAIQSALNARGFDAGPVDGQLGERTRRAIVAFQASIGTAQTGTLTRSELATLTGGAAQTQQNPSFDCQRASNPTEHAICANAGLASLDRDLADAWAAARKANGSDAFLADQRRWIAGRDTCRGELTCLEASMRSRIAQLGQVVSGGSQTADGAPDGAVQTLTRARSGGVAEISSANNLIYVDNRLLWSTVSNNSLLIPQGRDALVAHEEALAKRMTYTGWQVGSDNLVSGLAEAQHLGLLPRLFKTLPHTAQDEIVRLGLDASSVTEVQRNYCINLRGGSRFSCATQYLQTEFDRRRFQQAAAQVIARIAETQRLDMPIPVHVLCPLGQIDTAYDFATSTVNWAMMINGGCRLNGPGLDLGAAVPETSPMDAALVERLARSYLQQDNTGQKTIHPLMLSFDGEVTIERGSAPGGNSVGIAEVTTVLNRVGPVSLRSSAAPQEIILTFNAPSSDRPSEAIDLSRAAPAYRLIETAAELDAAHLLAAVADPTSLDDGFLVRLPSYPTDGEGSQRLSIANFFLTEEPAQRIATLVGQPPQHVAWTQLIAREQGVPNTELVLVFPTPYEMVISEPLDPDVVAAARQGSTAFLLARISKPMRMQGAAGPALVAVVAPLGFEIQGKGIGGVTQVLARPPLANIQTAPQKRVFLPSAWWFAFKGAELKDVKVEDHLATVFDRANLYTNDTFGRLDAIEEARAVMSGMSAPDSDAPWIAGRVTLGPYDLEQKGWPVNGLNIVLPVRDKVEAAIARRVWPDIETSGLIVPMPIDEARAFQNSRGQSGPLEFYARVELSAPRSAEGINVMGHLRELLLFPLKGSPSQQMQISPTFDPEEALSRIVFEALQAGQANTEKPASSKGSTPLQTAAVEPPDAPNASQPEKTPTTDQPEATPKEDWPDTSEFSVEESEWDILGLRTGMTMKAAEDKIRSRGSVLAVFERPHGEINPVNVKALHYQRLYVTGDGTEAITLAAPAPDGPVLAIMRRIQLQRGTLPFKAIQKSLVEKYGDPMLAGPDVSAMTNTFWFSGKPGPWQPICRAYFPVRVSIDSWRKRDNIGDPSFNTSVSPAPWDWAVADIPVDYLEQMSVCGQVLAYAPENTEPRGGKAFSMLLFDAAAIREVDEVLAGTPEKEAIEIDF